MKKNKIAILSLLIICIGIVSFYVYRFYPRQAGELPELVNIQTPEVAKYKNDCLHPCIRQVAPGFAGYRWWMVQSPFYNRNSEIENPILYHSTQHTFPSQWDVSAIIAQTPASGFNSDPNLFYENGKLWIFWREFGTPLCNSLSVGMATVGVYTVDGKTFSPKKVYLTNKSINSDSEQAPVIVRYKNRYRFYAANYQYTPQRNNSGVAIWEGSSLDSPDFKLKQTVPFKSIYTCGRMKQLRIGNKLLFIPKPQKHDLWHFDLFEYKNKLYMFSVSEWGDNIMLSVSDDYTNFKTFSLPLVNNHYLETYTHQRTYFYKPTGYIENDTIYLYYTATNTVDKKKNDLYKTKIPLSAY